MFTFLQAQNDIITQLKEDVTDPNYWDLDEIKDAINDTYIFIADEELCFKLERIIVIRIGIRKYKLPEDYIYGSLNRVEFNEKAISPISSMELDALNTSWRNESGSLIRRYIPPGDLCNTDEIMVHPEPDTEGATYILASTSQDYGVIVAVNDDSYEEFNEQEGVIVDTDGNAQFEELMGTGPVLEIQDPTDNLRIFGARYPKKLFNDWEVFLHPITYNPRKVITHGSLAILYSKEGQGKDIAKASYYNKRFMESLSRIFSRPKSNRTHVMRSITDYSVGNISNRGLNLGENYPSYMR